MYFARAYLLDMKYKIVIAFLLIVAGSSLRAQYINTDSIIIAPGLELVVSLKDAAELQINSSSTNYDDNLSGGKLLMQFAIPSDGKVISRFGPRSGRMHTGTDLKMQKGDTIYAAFNGEVSRARYYYGYGNMVVLQHEKNLETYYAHLSKLLVENGDWVKKGEPLGLAGATGRATTSHLHFEIRENDKPYDAELVFDFESAKVRSEIGNTETLAALFPTKVKPKSPSESKPSEQRYSVTQDYIVRSGDSLWKISKRASTSIQTLCQLNELSESTILQVGQIIKVF